MQLQRNVLQEALRRTRGSFGTIALFSLCINLLALTGPIYMLQLYGRVLSSYKVETLITPTVMMAAAYAAYAALDGARTAITVRLGAWLTRTVGPYYLESSIQRGVENKGVGTDVLRDLDKVQGFVATQGMNSLFDAPWTPIFIAIIWMLHPWLGIFALFSALLLLVLSIVNAYLTRGPLHRAEDLQTATMRVAGGAIRHAEAVSAMGMGPAMIARWKRRVTPTWTETCSTRAGGAAPSARSSSSSARSCRARSATRRISGHPGSGERGRDDRRLHPPRARACAGRSGDLDLEELRLGA